MAKKIEIGTELDERDWIALNEYLNNPKEYTPAAIECMKSALALSNYKSE